MKKFLKLGSVASIALLTPILAFATNHISNDGIPLGGVEFLIYQLQRIVSSLVPLLIGVAVVVFCWGIIKYLFTGDKEQGKTIMVYGIVALFVMTSIWGLVGILRATLFGQGTRNSANNIVLPGYPGANNQ